MLTEKEIQKQISEDEDRFNFSIYDGYLPPLFVDYFRKTLMVISPAQHKYPMAEIKKIMSKKLHEINVLEVGLMINIVYHCPFEKIYSSLEEGVDTTMEFDKIREEYNQKVSSMTATLTRKRDALYRISGIGSNTANLGNLKKLPQA